MKSLLEWFGNYSRRYQKLRIGCSFKMSSGSCYKDLCRNAIDRLNVVTTQNSDRPCKCIKVEDMGFLLSKDRQSGVGNSLGLLFSPALQPSSIHK